jgi:ATP-binding protein involved in chromosome partitioning
MADLSQDVVRAALARVPYPGFSRDIVSFGLLKDISVESGAVRVQLVLTTRDDATKAEIVERVRAAVLALPGVREVEVAVSQPAPRRLPSADAPAEPPAPAGPNARNIIGVASGKGGVGKSTVAVNLAAMLARRGRRVGFLDADVHGPSAPLMFGLEGRKPDRADADGHPLPLLAHGVRVMSMGFFVERGEAVIWRGPIVGNVIKQLLTDIAWGELDDLVIDFPPGTGDAQLTISQTIRMTGAIVVSTPNDLALVDALKAIAMFRKVGVPVFGLVENMSFFVCPHCQQSTEIFGHGLLDEAAASNRVPVIGRIPMDPEVVSESDRGVPVVVSRPDCPAGKAYQAIAENVLGHLDRRDETPPGPGAFLDRFGK